MRFIRRGKFNYKCSGPNLKVKVILNHQSLGTPGYHHWFFQASEWATHALDSFQTLAWAFQTSDWATHAPESAFQASDWATHALDSFQALAWAFQASDWATHVLDSFQALAWAFQTSDWATHAPESAIHGWLAWLPPIKQKVRTTKSFIVC